MINLIALAFLLLPSKTIAYQAPPLEIHIPTIEEQIETEFGTSTIMLKVAKCESGLRQFNDKGEPLRSNYGTPDYGLFQVNEPSWDKKAKELNLDYKHSLQDNIKMAKYIKETQGLSAWNPSHACWSKV